MRAKYLANDYNARLHGGVAFYEQKPVCVEVDGQHINIFTFPERSFIKEVKPDDPNFDISAPTLGFVNTKNGCHYIYRRPERKYKQTLQPNCLGMITIGKKNNPDEGLENNDIVSIFYESPAVKNMLLNKYPSLEEALELLRSETRKAIAFHKDVALYRDSYKVIRVYFKGLEVGRIKPERPKYVKIKNAKDSWIIAEHLSSFNWMLE